MWKKILFIFLLVSLGSLSFSLSDFTVQLGLPGGNFGVEYQPGSWWGRFSLGGLVSRYAGLIHAGAAVGYEWELGPSLKLRPLAQVYALQRFPNYNSDLPELSYISYDAGLGLELRYRFSPRWSASLGLPVIGVHFDNFGFPPLLPHYYLDALAAQPILSVEFRI